jgi:leader peptidase (prepilin peptidase)/N-methyltransferase
MFVNSLFLAAIIVLMFIDYEHQILPNILTIPGAAAGILLSPLQLGMFYSDSLSFRLTASISDAHTSSLLPWSGALVGALMGGGVLLLVALPYQLLRKRQGLGAGDVKMMAMVGTFLGWRLTLLTVFLGSALGLMVGIFLMLFRRGNLQTKLPFGTLLGAASVIALFYGLRLIQWYVGSTPGNS